MHWRPNVRFNRNELAGAFGDIGTDLPLIVGIIQTTHMNPTGPLISFGLAQLFTGLVYGIPMPVQPLKAMAVIVMTQKLAPNVLWGAGLAIAVTMLVLTATGLLSWLARVIPLEAIRGVQLGLGLQLARLALKEYMPSDGAAGWALAVIGLCAIVALLGHRRVPGALVVIAMGLLWSAMSGRVSLATLRDGFQVAWPTIHVPTWDDVWTGFLVLAIPQIPLSLSNSLFATASMANDLFPERKITVRKLGFSYAGMNFLHPFLGGIPTCHGCGGMAGHCFFGARTGGSVVIYGSLWLFLGLFFAPVFGHIVKIFPMSLLGLILAFEALALMRFLRDVAPHREQFFTALIGGMIAAFIPYGYVWALLIGSLLHYAFRYLPKRDW